MDRDRHLLHDQTDRFDAPLDIESISELHAARILILLHICGHARSGVLHGRTKLAKLDFFVRYPRFLEAALHALRAEGQQVPEYTAGQEGVEASMIRYRFGPWDHRYYDLLAFLEARGLIRIGGRRVETYSLTARGRHVAESLEEQSAYRALVVRCTALSRSLAGYSGTALKDFIYRTFESAVTALPIGATIVSPASGQETR